MTPVFSRKNFLFLVLGVFALLFGMAQSASADTCFSYGDGSPEWRGAGTITGCTIQYDDPVGGSNLTVCQYRILSNGGETVPWANATGTCSGSSATLSINISIGSGLNCQHEGVNKCEVQYKAEDNAGNSGIGTIVTLDIDYAPPYGGSISYDDGFSSSSLVSLTVNYGTDADSGINPDPVTKIVQRRSATLSNGTCGAYGSFAQVSCSGTYPSLYCTSFTSGTCYQYQYLVSDLAGNQKTYATSPTSTVKVDKVAPRVDAFDVTPNAVVSWTASDTGGSSIQKHEVWRAPDSGGSQGAWVRVIDNAVSPAPDNPADGTYWYGLHVKDNALNCITEDTSGADKGHCGGVFFDGLDTRPDRGPIKVIVDKTAPSTSLTSVAGDTSSPYWDTTNNLSTDIVISGEANMLCRWGDTDAVYSSMPSGNSCPVSGSTATCSLSLPQLASYTKHVSCRDAAGNEQPLDSALPVGNKDVTFGVDWTAPSDPGTTPSTTSPTNNTRPTWSWSAFTDSVSGVASYDVRWATNPAFTQNLGNGSSVTNSFTHSSALAENTWHFKAKARDAAGNESGFSSYGTVVIDTTPPGAPNLISPSGTISTTTPTFNWNTVSDPSGVTYTLWVDNNSNFGSLEINQSGLTSSSYTPGGGILVDGTTYYWKVRAVDGAGNTDNFPASPNSFTVVLNQPSASPTSPLQFKNDGSTSISNKGFTNETTVKLRASATDADTSEVIRLFFEVALNSGSFASPATPTTGTSCASGTTWGSCANKIWYVSSASGNYSSTPFTGTTSVAGLSTGTGYKWQVKACDDSGACSGWVGINPKPNFSVDTQPPTITTFIITPDSSVSPNWANNASPSITVTWNVSDQGSSHLDRVRVYRAPFDSIDPDRCDDTNKLGCVWTPVGSDVAAPPNSDNWNCPSCVTDTPGSGTWWYGMHVWDKAQNETVEPTPPGPKKALVDTNEPNSQIQSPASSSWFSNDFTLDTLDEDLFSGLDTAQCQYKIIPFEDTNGDGIADTERTSSGWLSRTCNAPPNSPVTSITVGTTDYCKYQAKSSCWVYIRSKDVAGNLHTPTQPAGSVKLYNIDWTQPEPGKLYLTANEGDQTYPIQVQLDQSNTYKVHVTDNLKVSGCSLYIDGIDQEAMTPTVPGCEKDCTFTGDFTFTGTGTYHNNYAICKDAADNSTSGTSVNVEVKTLSVGLSVVPSPGGSVNTLFDLTANTAGSTMTGDTTYGFDCRIDTGDCTADGNFADCDLSVTTPTGVTSHTADNLCQYPVTAGTYTAKVAIQRGVGTAQDTASIGPITTNSVPEAAITCDPASCVVYDTEILTLMNASSDPDGAGDITKSVWDILNFGAGAELTCPPGPALCNYTIQPMPTGDYTAQLSVEDLQGDTDNAQQPFTLKRDIVVNFACSLDGSTWQACSTLQPSQGEVVQFKDASIPSEGASIITSWIWTFQGGIPASANTGTTSTIFQSSGSKIVTLQVTDNGGRVRTGTQTINLTIPFPEWQEISPF